MTKTIWYSFNRDLAAIEVLEHAVALFEERRSLPLVRAVAQSPVLYFAERVRPGRKGKSALFEMANVMKEVLGPSFDEAWFRNRAWKAGNELKHWSDKDHSTEVMLSRESVAFVLLCAIADCRKALGAVSPKLEEWRERQVVSARAAMETDPDRAQRAEEILRVAQARGALWLSSPE